MAVKTIKPFIKVFFLLFIAAAFSCEEQGWLADCDGCTQEDPAFEYLTIRFSNTQPVPTISIYEGELEDGVLLNTVSPGFDTYTIAVRLNKKYTATASYEKDGKKYTAVDSAIPRTKFTENQCTDPCYYVYDNELDLRIKYMAD